MHGNSELSEISAEYERIGLKPEECPYGIIVGHVDGPAEYLEMLRALPVGATWRAVFPDMPAHWVLDDPDSWTEPYRPFGAFDFQQLPAGAAVLVTWDSLGADQQHQDLVSRARASGFSIHGGAITSHKHEDRMLDYGYVVMELGNDEMKLLELHEWITKQDGVHHATPWRREDDSYAE